MRVVTGCFEIEALALGSPEASAYGSSHPEFLWHEKIASMIMLLTADPFPVPSPPPLKRAPMSEEPIAIKRYPNRRFYAKITSKYVSLTEIEQMIREGRTVEIRDSQSGDDITRPVLTQLIIDRQPEKMSLFPSDMLHFIVRSNDLMSGFLRDYFRHSLTYLDYLQKHSATARSLSSPVHWVKAWLDGITPGSSAGDRAAGDRSAGDWAEAPPAPDREAELAQRVEQLEARLRQLESRED